MMFAIYYKKYAQQNGVKLMRFINNTFWNWWA